LWVVAKKPDGGGATPRHGKSQGSKVELGTGSDTSHATSMVDP
jgi:hypothetical protein